MKRKLVLSLGFRSDNNLPPDFNGEGRGRWGLE